MNLLVWDFDGTLAHRDGLWSGTLETILQRHCPESEVTRIHLRPFLARGFRWHQPEKAYPVSSADDWWAELEPVFMQAFTGVGATRAEASAWVKEVRAEYIHPQYWQVFPDTMPTLETLARQGWTHAILTNHVPEFRELLQGLKLTPHFSFIVNSAETGVEKPHPQAFSAVLEQGGPPQQICMIGDSLRADIHGAHNVGWPAILVRNDAVDYQWKADTLGDVPNVLNEIFS